MARRVWLSQSMFRVSFPGYDAATTTDTTKLAFWEGQDSLIAISAGTFTMSGSSNNIYFPGYIEKPLFMVWSTSGGNAFEAKLAPERTHINIVNYSQNPNFGYVIYKNMVS